MRFVRNAVLRVRAIRAKLIKTIRGANLIANQKFGGTMFAHNLRTEVVIRVLLIVMIFFNPLTSSIAFAQAKQESTFASNPNTEETEKKIVQFR